MSDSFLTYLIIGMLLAALIISRLTSYLSGGRKQKRQQEALERKKKKAQDTEQNIANRYAKILEKYLYHHRFWHVTDRRGAYDIMTVLVGDKKDASTWHTAFLYVYVIVQDGRENPIRIAIITMAGTPQEKLVWEMELKSDDASIRNSIEFLARELRKLYPDLGLPETI